MIYSNKKEAKEKEFITILEKARQSMITSLKKRKNVSSSDFERIVYEHMCAAAKGTSFDGSMTQTGTYAFPDIIAQKYFGVEVKMTIGDHWTSTGNSVLESSRNHDIDRIYIMFGKFGGTLDIKYRLYQECLPEISVTHSPRYRIHMELKPGESIFDKMGVHYDTLRKDQNSIQKIKEYYRAQLKDGEELWWIDQENDEKVTSPVIRQFRNLTPREKEDFLIETMILFPEVFGMSTRKYERPAAYLVAQYNAVSANQRDAFTAGGKVKIKIQGKNVLLPQVAYRLYIRAEALRQKIHVMDPNIISSHWRTTKLEKDILQQWKKRADENFAFLKTSVAASDVFDAGLLL